MTTARFKVLPGTVVLTDSRPGNHATMFGPNGKLAFDPSSSSFDDAARSYSWAFSLPEPLANDERLVFATTDREVSGQYDAATGTVRVVDGPTVGVAREDGKPVAPLVPQRSMPRLRGVSGVKVARPSRIDLCVKARPLLSPKVSVMTCTYNRPGMLREAVECLRAQTEGDWEHLVYDDASTDEEVEDVLWWAERDRRVRAFRAPKNADQPARYWNEMVDRARGRYLCFLDDDNAKSPDFLRVLSGVLDRSPDVDMVTCGFTVLEDGEASDNHLNLTTASEVWRRNTVDTGAFLIRREAMERIGYFPLDIRTNEDWAMMRRAAACLRIEHLPDCLATYRVHGGQRMRRCAELGNARDKVRIEGRGWAGVLGARVHAAPIDRLTPSQRDVVDGFRAGVASIPWIGDGPEVGVVLGAFRVDPAHAARIAAQSRSVVSVHMEDPYALEANLARVRAMASACADTWVATNDTACVEAYREVVGPRVIVCPSLSVAGDPLPRLDGPRAHDVLLVGHAYPSRVRFVGELLRKLDRSRLKLVGDGWREAGYPEASPTAPAARTTAFYSAARAVVCTHRLTGDCGGAPHDARLVQRGYVEGSGGARVFVDRSRPDHSLDDGDAEWFDGPDDLAEKLARFLSLPDEEQAALAEPLRQRSLREFTYRARAARIINAVRSPRFGAVIP